MPAAAPPSRVPFAWAPVLTVAGLITALLVGFAGRYGYHGDELYFIAAGHHPAWGYPDQPPFTPMLARLLTWIAPHSLVVLRVPSAFAGGAVVVLAALFAREFGGGRGAQLLAALGMGLSGIVLAAGHLLSTTTFDVLLQTAALYVLVRMLRTGNQRLWLVLGLLVGVGMLVKGLVAFLAFGIAVALLITGPREAFRSRWLWVGAVLAALLALPYVVWQATHGWPQITVARGIANGQSGTSAPRAAFIPLQLILLSPWLAPVWITGFVRLLRSADLRVYRVIPVSYLVLTAVFIATGAKPYYLAPYYPLLLGAGSPSAIAWLDRGRRAVRRGLLTAALVLSAGAIPVVLPVIPISDVAASHIVDANYDAGDTIGWPTYAHEIAAVEDPYIARLAGFGVAGNPVAVLADSYSTAGAVERFLGRTAYSGQDGFYYWGPPPPYTTTVVAVGFDRVFLERSFTTVRRAGRLDNHVGVDNDRQHQPVWICAEPRAPWPVLWPRFKYFG
jgi:4-amino-4-deoxy-L-arabinose transferase-like glycosyltransferase